MRVSHPENVTDPNQFLETLVAQLFLYCVCERQQTTTAGVNLLNSNTQT